MRAHGAEDVLTVIDSRPHEGRKEVDVQEEDAQEEGESQGLGEEQSPEADRQRGEDLIIAAVGEQGVPLEHDQEAHHDHRKGNEEAADHGQVPPVKGEGLEEDDDEGTRDGQKTECLSKIGFRFSLRRKRFFIQKPFKEMPDQQAHSLDG